MHPQEACHSWLLRDKHHGVESVHNGKSETDAGNAQQLKFNDHLDTVHHQFLRLAGFSHVV